MMNRVVLVVLLMLMCLAGVVLAQEGVGATSNPEDGLPPAWGLILANLINMTLVLAAVQLIKSFLIPSLSAKGPVVIQALAMILGLVMPMATSFLTELTGYPIDLNPIIGAFTGVQAIGAFHVLQGMKK